MHSPGIEPKGKTASRERGEPVNDGGQPSYAVRRLSSVNRLPAGQPPVRQSTACLPVNCYPRLTYICPSLPFSR